MSRQTEYLVIAFGFGCIAATTISGCSQAADRTLSIHQMQSMETYVGQFKLDTSELPADAVVSTVDSGGVGNPASRIELNANYEFELVLRVTSARSGVGQQKTD